VGKKFGMAVEVREVYVLYVGSADPFSAFWLRSKCIALEFVDIICIIINIPLCTGY